MGEAKRRQKAGLLKDVSIKMPPRKRLTRYAMIHHARREETGQNGVVYALNTFVFVDEAGNAMIEETPDGPLLVSLTTKQPIKRAILASAGGLAVVRS